MFKKHPCVLQRDETDCGPAVLATVALYYRLPLSLERIRDACGTDLGGTNLRGLGSAALDIGFSGELVFDAQWEDLLNDFSFPAIAQIRTEQGQGHFIVVYQVTPKSVKVADPMRGVEWWDKEEFLRRWRIHASQDRDEEMSGFLLLLAPPLRWKMEASAPRWRRLLALVRPSLSLLFEAFLAAILASLLALGSSFFIQTLVDHVLVYKKTSLLDALGLGMVVLIVFRAGFGLLRQYLLIHLAQRVDVELVLGYYNHLLKQPMHFFRSRRVGEILSRMSDAQRIRAFISGTTLGLLLDITMFVFAAAVMFLYNGRLALSVFAFLPVFFTTFHFLNRAIRKIQRRLMEQTADLEAHLVESVSGIATLKSFAAEPVARKKTEQSFLRLVGTEFRSATIGSIAGYSGTLLSSLGGLVVMWYGGHLVIDQSLSIGQLMFFISLLAYLFGPMERLVDANVAIQDAFIAFDRLEEILERDPEQKPGFKGYGKMEGFRGEFSIENLTFSYGHRDPVLTDITLKIEAGTTVAIVGESGSGKTTLANLLARFDDPAEGRILLDGIDLRDWDIHALRKMMGIVPQETFIFRGKVRDNIALGHQQADLEKVIGAAKQANAHAFIARLPERYETQIGERGSDLSGGERQRLAIARALLHDPRVLILDEATSNLDSEAEFAIQKTLAEVKKGTTTVLIAHRLSTVMRADRIVVLDQGRVAEEGTHEFLISRKGKYFSLWQRQLPRESEDGPEREDEARWKSPSGMREDGPR